jgi:hypothetical protein
MHEKCAILCHLPKPQSLDASHIIITDKVETQRVLRADQPVQPALQIRKFFGLQTSLEYAVLHVRAKVLERLHYLGAPAVINHIVADYDKLFHRTV